MILIGYRVGVTAPGVSGIEAHLYRVTSPQMNYNQLGQITNRHMGMADK